MAKFWASRVTPDAPGPGQYSIYHVIPPDEYAEHGVNNSAFTNVVAGITLRFATEAAKVLHQEAPAAWTKIADGLVVPVDEERNIHLEYDGYNGQMIKQVRLGSSLRCLL